METETQAAPSPAIAAEPQLDAVMPKSGSTEYAEWRLTGKLPEGKEETQAESSTDDQPKEASSENEAEPEPAETQEPRKSKTARRWKKLTDEVADLRRQLAESRQPAQQQPIQRQPVRMTAEPQPTDTKEDGSPKYSSYEDYMRDAIKWGVEQGIQAQMQQMAESQQRTQLKESVAQARERYQDFDSVGLPVANQLLSDPEIHPALKARINNSRVLPDLLYTIGGDAAFKQRFLQTMKTDPEAARDAIALMEHDIYERLNRTPEEQQNEVPVKPLPQRAPEPPLETGNRGREADSATRLLEAVGRGDRNATRQWMDAENRRALARRRGA